MAKEISARPDVIYRPKKEMYPRFGYAIPERQTAYVRSDLPASVRRFVTSHELYHLADSTKGWIWREVKANMHAAARHPFGFTLCLLMSLTPYRLYYYLQRIIGKQF